MTRDLNDKVIVITGASSGIGAAVALQAARAEMHVVLGARRFRKLLEVRDQITAAGGKAIAVRCDVAADSDVETLVQSALKEFGQLDVVFANAGYGFYDSVVETPDLEVRAIFETNFFGTLRLVRVAVPIMRLSGSGHVIICSSAVSEISPPMFGIYCATKAAQDSIACALRAELADSNIHVTSVHPVGTQTEFFDLAAVASPGKAAMDHMPSSMRQSADLVARRILNCMKQNRPRAEVWPFPSVRFGLAIMTAFPGLSAMVMRRMHRIMAVPKTSRPAGVESPDKLNLHQSH